MNERDWREGLRCKNIGNTLLVRLGQPSVPSPTAVTADAIGRETMSLASRSPPPPPCPSSSHKRGTTEGTSLPHPPASTNGPFSHKFVLSLSEPAAGGSSHGCPAHLMTCRMENFLVVLHPPPMSCNELSVVVW